MFDRRTTLHCPTRSGLLGMFCAAMGIDRADSSGLEQLSSLRFEVLAYAKTVPRGKKAMSAPGSGQKQSRVDVRRWIDFHTVGGGYDPNDPVQRRFMVPKANGAKPDTVVTYREFLADACFVVLVTVSFDPQTPSLHPPDLLERLHQALCDPCWGIWFGRKCCVPTFPVCHGVHPNRDAALAKLAELAEYRPLLLDRPLRCVAEVDQFDAGSDTLMDVPLDFHKRLFAPRRVLDDPNPPAR